MKRVLTFLAIMLLPLSVMAMTPVSDADLADVTGQAGVSINADLTMNIAIGTMAWGDATGLDVGWDTGYTTIGSQGNDSGGYVGITNFNINNLQLRARETDTWNGYFEAAHLKPITIDVASDGAHGADVTFVRFGLGSLEISMDYFDFDVMLGEDPAAMDQKLGDVYLGAIRLFINPGSYVDIFNARGAGTSGVTMDMYVLIDRFEMAVVSWGDSDGLTLAQTAASNFWIATTVDPGAGYVGLENLVIAGTILVDGAVSIDVVTVSNGKYILPTAWHSSDVGKAVVHITLGELGGDNFIFAVNGPITANVKLDAAQALGSANATTLGDIYVSGFNVEILGGSWVDI